MLYQKKGDTVLDSGKVFTVGGEVFANHACDYEGLFGTVTEIRTGPDQCGTGRPRHLLRLSAA